MAHSLSSHQIALLVGSQAFSRGERYARNGNVNQPEWFGTGTQLFGEVQGTRPAPYAVTVSFTANAAGALVRASGVCTCPMKKNCKHVAALLIATAGSPGDGTAAGEPGRAVGDRRMPRFEPSAGPLAPPVLPDWQRALAPLARPASAVPAITAVGLQFELQDPVRDGRFAGGGARPRRLAARPVVMGKKGKWIRGNLTWDNLAYVYGAYDPAQLAVLKALYALYSAGNRSTGYAQQWILLDGFANRAFWEILAEASTAGLALVTTASGRARVDVSPGPAALELDIRRADGALTLLPAVILDGRRLDRTEFGFIGSPAHGVFTWAEPAAGTELGDAGAVLTLAPLEHQLGAELLALAASADALVVPGADEALFLADFYPFLRRKLTLTSIDGSFDLPETPRPRLALQVTHRPGARLELHWDWEYLAAGAETGTAETGTAGALYRSTLRPAPGDTRFRDATREQAILTDVLPVLTGIPSLAPVDEGLPRLATVATLAGAAMIDFLAGALAELEARDDIRVTVSPDAPRYRPADDAPVISLATTESTASRDWFDLAVTVSIDEEEIPFDDLFRALAADQEILILDSGTWFSLDRPELHQLRRLIEEARGLQDGGAQSLGLSRFQADLWEELQALGVVSEQAAGWRAAVAGLTDADRIDRRPLPAAVHATLRAYQQSGFDWLSFLYDHRLGGILADDMGLGKTLQAIALIAHARDQASASTPGAPFLVVAPTSVVSNWAAECARFAPDLRVATITQTAVKRATSLASVAAGADVVITSYTLFRLDFDDYDGLDWAGLLLDEAQFVKNHQARAHQCARRLKTPFKLAITGTPMENNLMELWSLLSITAPGLFPSPGRFTDYYRKPIETDADTDRLTQLRRRIRPFMLRRTKDQVAGDLPEKQEQVLELELNPKHRKVYDMHLARERQKVLGLIEDLNANRFEIFRSLTMLRQLSLDASLYDEKYAGVPSTKLDALLELLEDTVAEGHRTLIFSQFTQYLGKARDRLDAAGISYSYLDGKTRGRARTIDDFKNGTNSVFLISLKAGGFGLNLTEADYVILLDPWWNPATEAQAVDRVHRIGQTKNVMVYRLVAKDTIEEKVMALKATKARLFESVMTDAAPRAAALTAADIRELLS
ncbi:superfamily II DNA or RNA helicase [Cryobacterium sp. MP_M5]|uniref:DEAD/DEAH box helicase n=1 Tax=unclassified Cryobacterium TaxID=2649013 RepID=UPI0018C98D9D|nr:MULTISPECIES: DEAD/DEAH box helicase [unclassified Cryobacterium]MBG6056586.1 superfamily II DNA or RNA helicase [Cryobacterium sp. MP_M3]MEC5176259.1 superfamily II DNA or RNA helicase [Cryobacterium sp. MP_M5]